MKLTKFELDKMSISEANAIKAGSGTCSSNGNTTSSNSGERETNSGDRDRD